MATLRKVTEALAAAAMAGQPVVLATVVRVVGSSYGGVGTRMLVRVDGTTVGLVSGGCLESDLAAHARRVHGTGRAETITYDARSDDDAIWGFGLGCNGMIEVLLEPLAPVEAAAVAALLHRALRAVAPGVLVTVIASDGHPAVGAHALLDGGGVHPTGDWGDGALLRLAAAEAGAALEAGRRGLLREHDGVRLAFETVTPVVDLLVCGSGPDALPVAQLAVQLGWDVTVVDHRPLALSRPERFADARVVECRDATALAEVVRPTARTAAVVMSHHFGRDADYVEALLASDAAYVGVLGPRARTERLLAELATRAFVPCSDAVDRLHGPVGLDLGGDGPEAIALAIVSEVSAVMRGRAGGHLRDRRAPLHGARAAEATGAAEGA
jgi:xanthine/CO dehydrogenase XdhC/CoxF family maturation factor